MLVVYTTSGCPWCRDVLKFLTVKRIPHAERTVRDNPVYFDELVKKSGQDQTPTLDFDGEILADTDREAAEKFLKEKGVLP